MKKYLKLTIISIILIGISSCEKTSDLPIQGTWLLVLQSGKPVTDSKQIKHYTDTHFSWEIADLQNNIRLAASGPYDINDNVVVETVEYAPEGFPYKGTEGTLEMEIRNDTLFTTCKMNADGRTWTEAHIRLK